MKALLRLLFLLLLSTALLQIAFATELAPRHRRTQVNENFRFAGMPFSEYLAHIRRLIAKNRVDLTPENREAVVEANSPFEWKPSAEKCKAMNRPKIKNGILLVHGLSDSPFLMRDLGRQFLARCFLVRSVLLPGHGTVPGDLLAVENEEWIKAVAYGIESFRNQVESLYLAGFSTGGTLSVYHALNEAPVKGLLLFAPGIKIKSNLGFMANWHKAISWSAEQKKWIDIAKDEDYSKYESFTFNAADQIYLLTQELEELLQKRKVKVPMFVAISEDDTTVDAGDAVRFFKSQKHPHSRMILYTNRKGDGKNPDKRIVRRASRHPAESVLNYSHTAIPTAPENPHYGRNGDYKNCMHYLEQPEKWKACKAAGVGTFIGELTDENLEKHTLVRLTYNPDFHNMMSDIDAFMDRIK